MIGLVDKTGTEDANSQFSHIRSEGDFKKKSDLGGSEKYRRQHFLLISDSGNRLELVETRTGVLDKLGVRKIVNAYGPATVLGGSVLDPRITEAMEEVSHCFVDVDDLLDKVNARLAQIL